ncbi:MAG TPA: universal stress protein [Burkholderiales bacterium]|nr:universal stress protein [Burkholderiales bacterium]
MYKHILVATDGSKLSAKAVKTAVRLAKSLGAKLTAAYVIAPFEPPMYSEAVAYLPPITPQKYRELAGREAKKALALAEIEAQTAGVPCSTIAATHEHPWRGIVRTAQSRKCDVIVMASHGRRGLSGLLLGSETNKVLTHSKIPVLVCR